MTKVLYLVPPPPPEPTKPVNFTHSDVLALMCAIESLGSLEGYEGLDARIYPQLERLHGEFLEDCGDDEDED